VTIPPPPHPFVFALLVSLLMWGLLIRGVQFLVHTIETSPL